MSVNLTAVTDQGYQMARNLQAKLPPSDHICLFDINTIATDKLVQEMSTSQTGGATVETAKSVADASKDAVCNPNSLTLAMSFSMMNSIILL